MRLQTTGYDSEPVVSTEPPLISTEPLQSEPVSKGEVSTEPVSKGEKKQKGIQVSKVEVSDNIVKFFAAKGLFKKQWIVVKEIPLLEIEHIEKFGNELSVTWKGTTYTFFSKEKTDIFSKLVDQVNGIIEGGSTEPPVAEPVAPQISTEPPSTSTEPSVVPPASTEPPSTSTEPSVVPPVSTEPPSTSTEPSVPAPTDVTQPAPEGCHASRFQPEG